MKGKKERAVALVVIATYIIVFGWLLWSVRNDLWKIGSPYISTARYQRLAERYDDFVGMKAEEVAPLVTKNGYYMILEPHTNMNGGDRGLFCFPLKNSHSREECFIYGFYLDEDHVILERHDPAWSTDEFFGQLEFLRAHTPD